MQTMIDKYGRGRVMQIVADFYGKVMGSPQLSRHFDGVDIHTLVAHQSAFLEAVMGGPAYHDPEQIRRFHARLKISSEDFEEMIQHLGTSLDSFGVELVDSEKIQDRYRGYADQVITAGT